MNIQSTLCSCPLSVHIFMILPPNTSCNGMVVFECPNSGISYLLKTKTERKVWEKKIIILLQDCIAEMSA